MAKRLQKSPNDAWYWQTHWLMVWSILIVTTVTLVWGAVKHIQTAESGVCKQAVLEYNHVVKGRTWWEQEVPIYVCPTLKGSKPTIVWDKDK